MTEETKRKMPDQSQVRARTLALRTPENREKLLELWATGYTWAEVTEIIGFSHRSIRRWMRFDETFYEEYIQAKAFAAEGYVDQIADLAQEVMEVRTDAEGVPLPTEKDKAQRVRAATDALKTAAQMRAPKKFGNLLKLADADGEKLTVNRPVFQDFINPPEPVKPLDGGALVEEIEFDVGGDGGDGGD